MRRASAVEAVLIERHYIDRDYIEDHGLFYSRSLFPYPNYCQRVHFMTCTTATTRRTLAATIRVAAEGREQYVEACADFSRSYLGFAVIKPLSGSPVGRTVLRTFPEETDDRRRRLFPGVRNYCVHVAGIELRVEGLPFQEQDVGVSACATTAIWSALQKVGAFENLPATTPATVTTYASKFALPFGRALPADEGLSVDQMCQAVQSVGVSPNLYGASDFATTRSYLYTALRSQMPPVLIMQHGVNTDSYHAVVAVGMRLLLNRAVEANHQGLDDVAANLEAVYVHDDRTGPYLRANLQRRPNGFLGLDLLVNREPDKVDPWIVTHVLVPTHSKIRLTFSTLRSLAADLVGWVHLALAQIVPGYVRGQDAISFETWTTRAHAYVEQLYFDDGVATTHAVRELTEKVVFPRYVGVVRLASPRLGKIDVLFDTTSTARNLNCIAVVVPEPSRRSLGTAAVIAQSYDAQLIY